MAKKEEMSNNNVQKAGFWLFLVGVVLSILAGFWPLGPGLTSVLIVLGLVVGFLNVTTHETTSFLLAVVSLVIVNSFGGNVLGNIQVVGIPLARMLNALVVFVVPATIVVALKTIYSLAHE